MRLFIVSQEVPDVGGVADSRPFHASRDQRRVGSGPFSALKTVGRTLFPFPIVQGLVSDWQASNREQLAYKLGFEHGTSAAESTAGAVIPVLGELVCRNLVMKHSLPFEEHCVTVPATVGLENVIAFNSRLFVGAFRNNKEFQGVLEADGRSSRIHVFNRQVARSLFSRHGGGIIEEGLYLLHPKRDNVLVPFRGFHQAMLQEMTREAHVVMGRLGAKRLEVEATDGVGFNGRVVSKVPGKSGAAEANATVLNERTITFEWGSSTFEPESVLDDCVWLRDNVGVMTIVDQRLASNLTRFSEFSHVDTTFNISIEVLSLFQANFQWARESTYRYSVEFFDRPSARRGGA